jgi:Uncharacterized conserved protein
MPYLFVYGLLRYGFNLHRYLKNSRFVGKAFAEGFVMYELENYPAILKGNGTVYGEVYEIYEDDLRIIDEVEGYRGEDDDLYSREAITVYFDYTKQYSMNGVFVYIYNQKIGRYRIIESGDYAKFLNKRSLTNFFCYDINLMEKFKMLDYKKEIKAIAKDYEINNVKVTDDLTCVSIAKKPKENVTGYIYITFEDVIDQLIMFNKCYSKFKKIVLKVFDKNENVYYADSFIL